jgi:pyruvate,water dikinase
MKKELIGIGASAGQAQGKAKWILTPQDIDQFEVGEVLLAKMTSPDWGEVFQKAAAVATEQGGMLCHAAIVAREEAIHAVVGLGEDLAAIPNGALVAVNGDEGVVLVDSSQSATT